MIKITPIRSIRHHILQEIRGFSKPRDWKYGLREEYLIENIKKKLPATTKREIKKILLEMKEEEVVYNIIKYKKRYAYWFLRKEHRF